MKRNRLLSLATAALLTALLLPTGCKKKADEADDADKPVVTVQAERVAIGSITEKVEADSVLAPLAQAAIVPKISAPVKRFLVNRGSHVRQGQVLAVLENADLAASVVDTRGSLEQAQATYNTTAKATVVEDTQQAQLNVRQTKAALDVQKAQTDARANLFAQGAIPKRDYDTARSALVQAQAAYDIAVQHLSSLQHVSRAATVQNAQGGLVSAEGKYQNAGAQLSYATIRSPLNGVVTDRPLFVGEMAQAGQPLLTVMDTSALLAKVHLTPEQVASLHVGDKAEIAAQGSDDTADGAVSLISPAADTGSTTLEVWVKVPNRDGALKPGTPVHVAISARTLENVATVPAESIITSKSGGSAVMVVGTDSLAHEREVKLGATDGKDTQVTEGVHPGEMVVTTGARSLEDKTKVKIGPAEDEDEGDKGAKAADDDNKKPAAGEDTSGTSKSSAHEGGGADAGRGSAADTGNATSTATGNAAGKGSATPSDNNSNGRGDANSAPSGHGAGNSGHGGSAANAGAGNSGAAAPGAGASK